ncbi:ribosomal protein L21-like protein [Pseudomassariella vexata]|uniref:Large ribosomal subunit protein bL21m n=1 Tax=Pseudomassariella vexata TaxID=1141098 RepID=A0A1Y2DSW5_9PEZI|nr:ribosomal protein L21-like protein [Pseudomassariella vexata]ORY62236.1 ribosomal protein L21-like protein [Pseudomassariella vexata]
MSRSLLRSVLEMRTPLTRLPPSFLLPIQATRSLSTTQQHIDPVPAPAPTPAASSPAPVSTTPAVAEPPKKHERFYPSDNGILYPKQPQNPPKPSPEAAHSLSQLLPLLRAQPAHYITAHIHGQPYLVTPGDQIRLPFKMPGVQPGDVLRLDRASVLGSRDYTLKGTPYIDERLFECRATVTGTESEPLRIKVKTKRRQRRNRTVRSKHRYTMLRISELKIHGAEAIGL